MSKEYLNNKTFETLIEAFQTAKKKKMRSELILNDLTETHERRVRLKKSDRLESLESQRANHKVVCDCYRSYQEDLAHAFRLLSDNIANYARFSGIDIDDAIQEGILICFEKIDRFDPRKGKAFNYMTTCILNHYRQIYRSIRNYNELKKRYQFHLQDKIDSIFIRNGRSQKDYKGSHQDHDYNTV